MDDRKESALSRWSRLKRESPASKNTATEKDDATAAAAQAEVVPTPMTVGEAEPIVASAVRTETNDAPQPTDDGASAEIEKLPDIETLTYQSNFAAFLSKSVPAALQRRALAKLWRSDPVLANLDGLNDYEDDYRLIAESGSPLRKLLEPESPAEMALERERRLPRRSSFAESREQGDARPRMEAPEKTCDSKENASAEDAAAPGATESSADET